MTSDPNADLAEMIRVGWPDASQGTVELMLRHAGASLNAILSWSNARRDAAVAERDAQIARLTSALVEIAATSPAQPSHRKTPVAENIKTTDHARGCPGREYTCTCGYDDRRDAEIRRLRDATTRAVTELDLLRHRMAGQAIPIDLVASLGAIVLGLRTAVEGGR